MKRVLLIGLPNVGKSTIFSRLINHKVRICTYPGSAVEVKRGTLKVEGQDVEIIDVPGVYNLFSSADNEKAARNILIDEKPDLVVQVSDAKNLKRSLALTSLLAEFHIPLVLVLNMVDEAAQKGIKVKRHKLEDMLGTAVVETVASEGVGISAVISALDKALKPSYPSRLPASLALAVQGLVGIMDKVLSAEDRGLSKTTSPIKALGDDNLDRWENDDLEAKKESPRSSRWRGRLVAENLGGIADSLPRLSEHLPDGDVQPRVSCRLRPHQPPPRLPVRTGLSSRTR